MITGPLGVIFYTLCPALGPLYIFGNLFPWKPFTVVQVWQMHLEPLALPGFRNSMPSLHVAWVLLAWWYSKGLSIWERSIAMFFLVVTLFATLGFGEHYLIDLVVAVPFAFFVYALSAIQLPWSDGRRRMAMWLGLGTTLLWIELLQFNVGTFWISPVIPWISCVATVFSAAMFQQYLARASQEAPRLEPVSAPAVPATVV